MNTIIPFLSKTKKDTKEADRIMKKYPDRIPVIVSRNPNSKTTPEIDKCRFLVPGDLTVGQFMYVIRKRLQLSPEKALFLFIDNAVACNTEFIYKVYNDSYDKEDRFLYAIYSCENTFG
jgi:GABA(A) receptor-associated protein